MIVTESTTTLHFIPSEALTTARVVITDDFRNVDVYDEELSLNKVSYYYNVTDANSFNFKNNEHYILEIFEGSELRYRASLYCYDLIPKRYIETKDLGDANNEYITL